MNIVRDILEKQGLGFWGVAAFSWANSSPPPNPFALGAFFLVGAVVLWVFSEIAQ